jgi:hypothetical protein
MNINSKDLRDKSKKFGTGCGSVPDHLTALSNDEIADFIDIFFDGVLDNVDTCQENGSTLVLGGCLVLKKLTITNKELKKFTKIVNYTQKEFLEEICDYIDIKVKKVDKIKTKHHPDIICWLFGFLVAHFGGAFRCDWMDYNNQIDLESE